MFQPPEVVAAVGAYLRRLGRAVPPGVVTHCGPERVSQDAPVRFGMTIEDDRSVAGKIVPNRLAEASRILVDGADLAAALILYCGSQKIPLPANATKTLEVYGGQLCLAFTMTANKDANTEEKLRL